MDLRVLSAGAVQRGLESAAHMFANETIHQIHLTFATAPVIRSRVENHDAAFDLVIAPLAALREFEQKGLIASGSSTVVGSVKAGVAVRQGSWRPDISSAQALKEELLACEAIVYTEGSSGIFAAELIERLSIGAAVKGKTKRLADAGAVMKFLASGKTERAIGFGQVTAIVLHADQAVKLVGTLPKEVESITTYAAGVLTKAEAAQAAQSFRRFLITPAARAAFQGGGVE